MSLIGYAHFFYFLYKLGKGNSKHMFHIYANRTSNSVLSPAADPDFFTSPSCWSTQGQLPESARGENSLTPNSLKSCSVKTLPTEKQRLQASRKIAKWVTLPTASSPLNAMTYGTTKSFNSTNASDDYEI